jgi:hypothetical protein
MLWGYGDAGELVMFFVSRGAAARWMQAVVCVALLVCVLVVVVLPQVDIPPTTLARRIVHITLSQLAVLTLVLAVRCHIPPPRPEFEFLHEEAFQTHPSRLSIMCVRLC